MGFLHIDHVGIVAYSIEQAQEILGDALGLELDEPRSQWPTGSYFAPEQTFNYFFQVGGGETQVEVLVPDAGATSGTARFLTSAVRACTTCASRARTCTPRRSAWVANGLHEVDLPRQPDGRRTVAFFHPRGTGGVLTELVPARTELVDTPQVHRRTERESSPNVIHGEPLPGSG